MPQTALSRLNTLLAIVPQQLQSITDATFSHKPAPNQWSKKEILGHLIDSAANNHQRFIRVQFEENPTIYYNQDEWVLHNAYESSDKSTLIQLWISYNTHLAHVIKHIPAAQLTKTCIMKDNTAWTLSMLITDYVEHMEHHLKQIVDYD